MTLKFCVECGEPADRSRCPSHHPMAVERNSAFGAGWVWAVDHEGGNEGGQGGYSPDPATFATFVPPSTADRLDMPIAEEVF